jgi:ribonuclease HII
MGMGTVCGWRLEEAARKRGARRIAGIDEVGRGPLFGPVVAAAVILPKGCRLKGLTDSKQLSEKKRNELDVEIRAKAVAWAIAAVDAETIDRINIRRASLEAMRLAVEQIVVRVDFATPDSLMPDSLLSDFLLSDFLLPDFLLPDFLLIDGRDTIDWNCPQQAVIHGDALSYSIAAASVLAKVHRDRLLVELDDVYPGYGLAQHKGYCSVQHMEALARLGPTPLHRKSYLPVAQAFLEFPDAIEFGGPRE